MRIINSELTYNQAVLESLIELTKNTPTKYFDPTIVLSEVYRRGYILESCHKDCFFIFSER